MFEWLLFCGVMFVAISFVLIGVWCEKLKEYIGSVVYVFTIHNYSNYVYWLVLE